MEHQEGALPEPGASPGQDDAGVVWSGEDAGDVPGVDDLPPEVIAYFRYQASTVLDRARWWLAAGGDEGAVARALLPVMTELRDLASTFGFVAVEELAESALSVLEEGRAAGMRELVDILQRAVTEEGAIGAGTGDDAIPPITAYLYRGSAALRRALELEETVRGAVARDAEALGAVEEVFDLIRIALSDEAGAAKA